MPHLDRRALLRAALWVAAAPMIVRASSLMPVRALQPDRFVPYTSWFRYEVDPPLVIWSGADRLLPPLMRTKRVLTAREVAEEFGLWDAAGSHGYLDPAEEA